MLFWQKPKVAVKEFDLDKAFQEAQSPDGWEPEVLTDEQTNALLERKWHLVHPNSSPVKLKTLEPSGLTEKELTLWYHAGLQEARHRFLIIVNTSWSKTELKVRLAQEGLTNGFCLFDQGMLDEVIKFLSD